MLGAIFEVGARLLGGAFGPRGAGEHIGPQLDLTPARGIVHAVRPRGDEALELHDWRSYRMPEGRAPKKPWACASFHRCPKPSQKKWGCPYIFCYGAFGVFPRSRAPSRSMAKIGSQQQQQQRARAIKVWWWRFPSARLRSQYARERGSLSATKVGEEHCPFVDLVALAGGVVAPGELVPGLLSTQPLLEGREPRRRSAGQRVAAEF